MTCGIEGITQPRCESHKKGFVLYNNPNLLDGWPVSLLAEAFLLKYSSQLGQRGVGTVVHQSLEDTKVREAVRVGSTTYGAVSRQTMGWDDITVRYADEIPGGSTRVP